MELTFFFCAVQLISFSRQVGGFTISINNRKFKDSFRSSGVTPISTQTPLPVAFQKKHKHDHFFLFADLIDAYGSDDNMNIGNVDSDSNEESSTLTIDYNSSDEQGILSIIANIEEEAHQEMEDENDDDGEQSDTTSAYAYETKKSSRESNYADDFYCDDFYDGSTNYRDDSSTYSTYPSPSPSPSAPEEIEFPLPRCTNIEPQQILDWNKETTSQDPTTAAVVVLVTHCTIDRLDNLKQQIRAWNGYASVVIYVSSRFFWKGRRKEIEKEFQSDGRVAVSIVHNTNRNASADPYPINYLRNLALLQAREQHARGVVGPHLLEDQNRQLSVLLVDVDFVPSINLQAVLHVREAQEGLEDGEVVIIPAFETLRKGLKSYLPRNIGELLYSSASGEIEGFHIQNFPQGHAGTDFDKFLALSQDGAVGNLSLSESLWYKRYKVEHSEGFEPYVVMSANKVPLYDERFQGYGLNKISHLASVAATVTSTFTVLPGVFLVAAAHERSKEWKRIYGKSSTSNSTEQNDLKSNLRALYKDFCQRLEDGEAPVVSEATFSRLKLLNDE